MELGEYRQHPRNDNVRYYKGLQDIHVCVRIMSLGKAPEYLKLQPIKTSGCKGI